MSVELEEAFKKNKNLMYKAARGAGANHAEAQDAVGAAWAKLSKMRDTISYVDEKKVRGLFCLMAKNEAIRAHDKTVLDVMAVDQSFPQMMSAPVGSMDRAIWVHQALSKLDDMERFIAWNYWALEYSLQEVCDMLAERDVEWTRQNLHKYLRKTLQPKLTSILGTLSSTITLSSPGH